MSAADPRPPAHRLGSRTSPHDPNTWCGDAHREGSHRTRGEWRNGKSRAPGRHGPAASSPHWGCAPSRAEGVHRSHHERQRIQPLELGHHRIDHCRIQERLIPLHIDHGRPAGLHRLISPGQRHQGIRNSSDAFTAGVAGFRRHQHREPQTLNQGLQLRTIRAKHHRFDRLGLTAAFENTLNHRLAANVSKHLVGQSGGLNICESPSIPELPCIVTGAEPFSGQRSTHGELFAEPGGTEPNAALETPAPTPEEPAHPPDDSSPP